MKDYYGCVVWIFAIVINVAINSFCFPYALNYWLVFFHKTAVVQWWQGALIGFVPGIGQLGIAFAVITWILSMFL